jgi:hypothetical protein
MRAEDVQAAIIEAPGDDAATGAVRIHEQIDGDVLDEEGGAVLQALLIESVEDGMAGAVGSGAGALDRGLAVIAHVSAEGPLIDLAFRRSREGDAEMLELIDRGRGVGAHVLDGVLVAEPVGALDRVVHVPAPVVLAHVAEGGANAALGGDRMAAGRENFGDAGGLEPGGGHAESGAQPGAAGADDDDVVHMLMDRIGGGHRRIRLPRRGEGSP